MIACHSSSFPLKINYVECHPNSFLSIVWIDPINPYIWKLASLRNVDHRNPEFVLGVTARVHHIPHTRTPNTEHVGWGYGVP